LVHHTVENKVSLFKSADDIPPGAFGVLREELSHRIDVSAVFIAVNLWILVDPKYPAFHPFFLSSSIL
jgi:hypothetical protein